MSDGLTPPVAIAAALAEIGKTNDAVAEALRGIVNRAWRALAGIMPSIRRASRYIALREHRRHQNERRVYAKAARRERTGWRHA